MTRLEMYTINESGLTCTVKYTKKCIRKTFIPLAGMIVEDFRKTHTSRFTAEYQKATGPKPTGIGNKRYILSIAGPPGCGKSSIARLLQLFISEQGIVTHVLPMDGFHLKNSELKKNTVLIDGRDVNLYNIKGAKETYDTRNLFDSVKKLSQGKSFFWPVYSRNTHDPVEKGVRICDSHCIYIIEGNYLLLNEHPWKLLGSYFNKRIFIKSKKIILRPRIIRRKLMGGISKNQARLHYRRSDKRNIQEVLDMSGGYDLLLIQHGRYRYSLEPVSDKL